MAVLLMRRGLLWNERACSNDRSGSSCFTWSSPKRARTARRAEAGDGSHPAAAVAPAQERGAAQGKQREAGRLGYRHGHVRSARVNRPEKGLTRVAEDGGERFRIPVADAGADDRAAVE